ncbi:branched-chain amino acid ABC transporter permease [Polaromonas sp. P1(28)-13]|nr:branched-chain amino acid ABC transporter permease [Polaromonas sp. P1(28)-13]
MIPRGASLRRPDSNSLIRYSLLGFAVALFGYAFFSGGYMLTVLSFAAIYAIFVTGLNFFMGYAGQVSFGQNAFAALSGYASAILTSTYGWQPIAALPVGVAGAVILALVVGYPALRLRGHYLAMATLALGMIVYEIAVEWQSITQGYMGISGIPPFGIGGWELTDPRQQLVFLIVVLGIALLAAYRMKESRFGMALSAIAGSEEAAKALGIDVSHYKLVAFVIAAVYAAIAGSLMAHFVGFVSPEVFGLHMVIAGFMMLYLGGIGSIAGPLFGALIVSLLPETFRAFKEYQDLAYGAALIVILIFAPKGAVSLARLIPKSGK